MNATCSVLMKSISQTFDALLAVCAWIAAGLVASVALAITVNVVFRAIGAGSIFGLLDLVEYALLTCTFLAAPWVLSKNAHVTVDLVTAALPMRFARPLARVTALVGAGTSAIFFWYGLEAMLVSAARGSMIRTSFVVPEWWALSVGPFGFALISLEFLRQAINPPVREQTVGL